MKVNMEILPVVLKLTSCLYQRESYCNDSYLAEDIEMRLLGCIPNLHYTDSEEESGTHMVAAYQKLGQTLEKKKITKQ